MPGISPIEKINMKTVVKQRETSKSEKAGGCRFEGRRPQGKKFKKI